MLYVIGGLALLVIAIVVYTVIETRRNGEW